MSDHKDYDQQRALQKLEQQRQEALRRASSDKDREALNAFYNNRRNSMPGSAGKKAGGCPPVLVALLAGAGGLVAAAAEGISRLI